VTRRVWSADGERELVDSGGRKKLRDGMGTDGECKGCNRLSLVCDVDRVCMTVSSQIVFWMNGSRIISTNRRVYVNRQRVSVEGHGNTYNLLVRDVRQWDDGEYSCQVPGPHAIIQTSRVIISSKFELQSVTFSQIITSPSPTPKYCDQRVYVCMSACLSVCLSSRMSQKPRPIFTKCSVHVVCGHGLILL